MMYVISGAVISANDGRRYRYLEKCDACGFVRENLGHVRSVSNTNGKVNLGTFQCVRCDHRNEVVIGCSKAASPPQQGHDAGYGAGAQSAPRQTPWLFRLVGKFVKRLLLLIVLTVSLGIGILVLNKEYHFIPDAVLKQIGKTILTGDLSAE